MDPIRAATAACLRSFSQLVAALDHSERCDLMPSEKVKREHGIFKIWSGNLGALQSGRGSLDFRLRESTVVRTNMLKLLAKLEQTLTKSILISDLFLISDTSLFPLLRSRKCRSHNSI
jgi:hypothetical protein